jgi:hypothetical protein
LYEFTALTHEFIVPFHLKDDSVRGATEPHVLKRFAVDSRELLLAVDADHFRAHQIGLRFLVTPIGRIGSLSFEKHE